MDIRNFDCVNDTKDFLPVYIVMAGVNHIQPGIERAQGFAHYQWIQTRSGSGFLEYGASTRKVGPNQGFLLPPNEPHAYYPSGEGWIQDWIAFGGCMLPQIIEASGLNFFEVVDLQDPITISSRIKKLLIDPMADLSELERSAIIYDIITTLSKGIRNKVTFHHPGLEQAVIFMNDNLKVNISIEDIAKVAGISPQYLCYLFKKHLKVKPFEYLAKIRISKGKIMLLQTPVMKINEVGWICGFNSASYFCTTFRRLAGCTPEEFRKIYRV